MERHALSLVDDEGGALAADEDAFEVVEKACLRDLGVHREAEARGEEPQEVRLAERWVLEIRPGGWVAVRARVHLRHRSANERRLSGAGLAHENGNTCPSLDPELEIAERLPVRIREQQVSRVRRQVERELTEAVEAF